MNRLGRKQNRVHPSKQKPNPDEQINKREGNIVDRFEILKRKLYLLHVREREREGEAQIHSRRNTGQTRMRFVKKKGYDEDTTAKKKKNQSKELAKVKKIKYIICTQWKSQTFKKKKKKINALSLSCPRNSLFHTFLKQLCKWQVNRGAKE